AMIQPRAMRAIRALDQRVLARYRRLGPPSDPLIGVGFSGGADSLCLAASFARLQRPGGFRVHLIHVDHGLREESVQDAERARELAAALNVPITVHRLAPGLAKRASGIGIEAVARRERYAAFDAICAELGIDLLALGHHQLDQAETVLLHLLRGAGVSGAAAMSELTESDLAPGVRLWRPLLLEPRSVIDATVAAVGLPPILDPSNDDKGFLRNWLRAEALPAFEARNPGSVSDLARFARIAAEEDRYLADVTSHWFKQAIDEHERLDWTLIGFQPTAVKRRIVKTWLDRVVGVTEISFDRVEAVLALAEGKNPEVVVQLGAGAIAIWSDGRLIAGPEYGVQATLGSNANGPFASPFFEPTGLQSGAPVEVDGWRLTGWGSGSIELRRVDLGDRMAGSGRPVRELARACGIHPLLRRKMIVAANEAGPVWVAGLPFAECGWRFELTRVERDR
ncbi:MAG: tRNA lysidine(34) synthetase TilS, partial [Rhizobiales bacterium]|nr:tRNA lysidine(34) synthetase TilS [Hyphomicrobiales bacterium]